MKYIDEYRDEAVAGKLVKELRRIVTKPWVLMEVCGGQTHTIVKYGIDHLLPEEIELVHGPGCPVCVTSLEMIDKAHAIAQRPDVIFCSFGDMLRVPGSNVDLLVLKSRGADVRVVYSPIDSLKIARANPTRKLSFLPSGSRPPRPVTRWRSGRRKSKESPISRCWSPTFWYLPRWPRFCNRHSTACRGSSGLGMSAQSWVTMNTNRLLRVIMSRLSSRASSRWISSKAS